MNDVSIIWVMAIVLAAAWEVYWKARGLWRASRNDNVGWFVVLLIVNTAGLLPIYYLVTHPEN